MKVYLMNKTSNIKKYYDSHHLKSPHGQLMSYSIIENTI